MPTYTQEDLDAVQREIDDHYLANRVEWARVAGEGFRTSGEKEDFHRAWVASGEHLAALLDRRDEIRDALKRAS